MKKWKSTLGVLLALALLAGCQAQAAGGASLPPETPSPVTVPIETGKPEDPWGVTLTAEEAAPTGLKLVCTQSGGAPTGELESGSWYSLEAERDGQWTAVEPLPQEYDVAWTMEAWPIPRDDAVEWPVDWVWLYGELPAGHYRLGKKLTDFRATGDYDEQIYYAEFELKAD